MFLANNKSAPTFNPFRFSCTMQCTNSLSSKWRNIGEADFIAVSPTFLEYVVRVDQSFIQIIKINPSLVKHLTLAEFYN